MKNTLNIAFIYAFNVISKLGWYWNKLKNANKRNVCNYQPVWIISWNCSMYYEFQNEQTIFKNITYNVITIYSVNFVPTDVSAWALKNHPSQKNRYLGTCVLHVRWADERNDVETTQYIVCGRTMLPTKWQRGPIIIISWNVALVTFFYRGYDIFYLKYALCYIGYTLSLLVYTVVLCIPGFNRSDRSRWCDDIVCH